ncbi:class I SAM-dependent DNA methyltransferase [Rhodococcus kronopolitis]|uniref:Class I SAM-dependent DNA methyltransferase n=1 Tax=Rhodococcus kronopolitis TaxID=1460226 RepID=A0ABV9FN50_9NOCA
MTGPSYLEMTRAAYDTVAADYAELVRGMLADQPFDRAMLAAFAEFVHDGGDGPVADLGCGPGRVTAHLRSLGLSAFGIDLSPEMVAVARRDHPGLRFEVGSMTELDLEDGVLAGIVAWYSIIHTPPELLPTVFAEFHRTLRPGGHLMLAFQVGDERVRLEEAYGHTVSYDVYRLSPDRILGLLREAGFDVQAQLVRERTPSEKQRQAYLMADKRAE